MAWNIVVASFLTTEVQTDKREKQRGGGGEAGFRDALREKEGARE